MIATSYHEAGHVVVSYRLGFDVGTVTIDPDNPNYAGLSLGESPWCDGSRDADYIVSLFAGFTAEKRYDPSADASTSSRDNAEAAELLSIHADLSERELHDKSLSLVTRHWPEIKALAEALQENVTLDGEEASLVCDAVDEGEDWRAALADYRNRWKGGEA